MNFIQQSIITRTFVSRPDLHRVELNELQQVLTSVMVVALTSTNLGTGLYRYEMSYQYPSTFSDSDRVAFEDHFNTVINNIQYYPLTISLFSQPQDNQGIISILMQLIKDLTGIPVTTIITTSYREQDDGQNLYVFSPITSNNTAVYLKDEEITNVLTQCNPDIYRGYEFLSSDLLIWQALKDIPRSADSNEIQGVRWFRSLAVIQIPRNAPTEILIQHEDFKNRIWSILQNKHREGYFALPISIISPTDNDLYGEIARAWETQVIDLISLENIYLDPSNEHISNILILKTELNFSMSAQEWFQQSLINIKKELFPTYVIDGFWMELLEPTGPNRAKIKYAAILAYTQLLLINPELIIYISHLNVGCNLAVTGMFFRYEEVLSFKKKLEFYIQSSGLWFIQGCSNINACVALRWKIAVERPDLHPMIVEVPSYGRYIVVDNESPNGIFPNQTIPIINEIEIQEKTEQFRAYLNNECGQQNGDLGTLLSLIVDDGVCFSRNAFRKILSTNLLNPKTGQAVSESAIYSFRLYPLGVYGLYSIGPIPGLLSSLPIPPIEPCEGSIIIQDHTVQVQFDDGSLQDLFDIDTTGSPILGSKLQSVVSELWNQGWFLTPWAVSQCKFFNKISLIIPRTIPLSALKAFNLEKFLTD